jgi:hypothetical protein
MTAVQRINFKDVPPLREEEFTTQTSYIRSSATYWEDVTTHDVMRAIEASGTLDFWNDPEEDIYSEDDGDSV